MRPIYKINNFSIDELLVIFKGGVAYLCIGSNCFLFRRKYWEHRTFSSKVFVAVIRDSVIYIDKPHSGLSRALINFGVRFEFKIDFPPSDVERTMALIEKRFQTSKY